MCLGQIRNTVLNTLDALPSFYETCLSRAAHRAPCKVFGDWRTEDEWQLPLGKQPYIGPFLLYLL